MAKTMSFKAGVKRHPEITVRPVSARDWQQRFQSNPPTSLEALLIKLGPFQAGQPNAIPNPIPNRDAFEFDNYVFSFTGERVEQIRQRYLLATDMVLGGRPLQLVRDVLNRLSVDIPLIGRVGLPKFIKDAVVGDVVSELTRLLGLILDWREPQFGECGGMAFSGYDFYLLGWTVDGRLGTTAPSTDVLDDYIFDRLLDSLELNARTFLEWFIILHRWQELATVANATDPIDMQSSKVDLVIDTRIDRDRISASGYNTGEGVALDADRFGDDQLAISCGIEHVDLAIGRHHVMCSLESTARSNDGARIGVVAVSSHEHPVLSIGGCSSVLSIGGCSSEPESKHGCGER
jgi:hypothetical protein